MINSRSEILGAKRIVIKVGSSSITNGNESNLNLIVQAVSQLRVAGIEVLVVSSGAIATGAPLLGLTARPDDLATSQALAAVGQARLMARYQHAMQEYNLLPAQMLLTVDNLEADASKENAKRALERLVALGVIPIINENDSVATQEIRFGDNDQLAAKVAVLAQADLLILFSDVDSIYTAPPSEPNARRIERVKAGDDLSGIQVSGTSTGYGTGGAITKLTAAQIASSQGVAVLLTATEYATRVVHEEVPHTWFEANS